MSPRLIFCCLHVIYVRIKENDLKRLKRIAKPITIRQEFPVLEKHQCLQRNPNFNFIILILANKINDIVVLKAVRYFVKVIDDQ